jgi:RNA polymerase sigma factor (sigma-70 family)
MNTSPSTRYSLLLRIKDTQDHAAWVEFVEIYKPMVYRLARHKGLQDADAHNLCQEVFQAVAQAASHWTPDDRWRSFRNWLFRVARNLIIDFYRQERRHVKGTGNFEVQQLLENLPGWAEDWSHSLEADQRRRLVDVAGRSIKDEFSNSTWQAFWRTAVQSRAVSEVAAELGISPGAVYIARSRVVARLRQRVREIEGEN